MSLTLTLTLDVDDNQQESATAGSKQSRSLLQKLRAENAERKEKEIQHVSPEQAEAITGYGEERTKREEEERKRTGKRGGNTNLIAAVGLG